MRWCVYCKRMVRGTKHLGVGAWIIIVLLSGFTLGLFLLFFLPWFFLFKKYECPICGSAELLNAPPQAASPIPQAASVAPKSDAAYCTNCGTRLNPSGRFCTTCGTPLMAAGG